MPFRSEVVRGPRARTVECIARRANGGAPASRKRPPTSLASALAPPRRQVFEDRRVRQLELGDQVAGRTPDRELARIELEERPQRLPDAGRQNAIEILQRTAA